MENEIWKFIENTNDKYKISNHGNVFSIKRGRLLGQFKSKKGYLMCQVTQNNKPKSFAIHRFVAIYFISNTQNKYEVNHKDGIKSNNHYLNLEWCTPSENRLHAYANGLHNAEGERNSFAKLNNRIVLEIRSRYESNPKEKLKVLAGEYGVTTTLISYIRHRKTWTHI